MNERIRVFYPPEKAMSYPFEVEKTDYVCLITEDENVIKLPTELLLKFGIIMHSTGIYDKTKWHETTSITQNIFMEINKIENEDEASKAWKGKEIFEYDIVVCLDKREDLFGCRGLVLIDKHNEPLVKYEYGIEELLTDENVKVIGNLFQNPELFIDYEFQWMTKDLSLEKLKQLGEILFDKAITSIINYETFAGYCYVCNKFFIFNEKEHIHNANRKYAIGKIVINYKKK